MSSLKGPVDLLDHEVAGLLAARSADERKRVLRDIEARVQHDACGCTSADDVPHFDGAAAERLESRLALERLHAAHLTSNEGVTDP